jgi:hypothetical protein
MEVKWLLVIGYWLLRIMFNGQWSMVNEKIMVNGQGCD